MPTTKNVTLRAADGKSIMRLYAERRKTDAITHVTTIIDDTTKRGMTTVHPTYDEALQSLDEMMATAKARGWTATTRHRIESTFDDIPDAPGAPTATVSEPTATDVIPDAPKTEEHQDEQRKADEQKAEAQAKTEQTKSAKHQKVVAHARRRA